MLRIFPALDPDLLVRAPDQLHFRLAMSATDYPGGSPTPDPEGAPAPPPLLDPQGVRQLARLVARLPRPDPAAPPPAVPPDPAPGAPALPQPASLPETP